MNRHRASKAGLTLIELLVGASISLIVAGVIGAVFFGVWRTHLSQETYAELQQKTRSSIDEISSAIQSAASVVVSVSSGGSTYQSTATSLVLRTPAVDGTGAILSGSDYFVFRRNSVNPQVLERIIIADAASARASLASPTTLNNSTGTLSFTYYSGAGSTITPGSGDLTQSSSVTVLVNSEKVVEGRTISRQIDNRVYLRNN